MSQPGTRLYRGRVADQIVSDLRRQILSGELPDGARLPAERELAAHYDVSAPTIREAIRVLASMGLLNTRNGSRTTVIANGDTMLRMSIASVAQFEKMRPGDVLALLGRLNAFATELAIERASDAEIEQLRAAAERTAQMADEQNGAAALRDFFVALAALSHNPLLAALCKALTEIQLGIAAELSNGDVSRVAGSLYDDRIAIVDAIARRDATAPNLIRDYHQEVVKRAANLPRTKKIRKTDPDLTAFLSTWLGAALDSNALPNRNL